MTHLILKLKSKKKERTNKNTQHGKRYVAYFRCKKPVLLLSLPLILYLVVYWPSEWLYNNYLQWLCSIHSHKTCFMVARRFNENITHGGSQSRQNMLFSLPSYISVFLCYGKSYKWFLQEVACDVPLRNSTLYS